MVGGRWGEESGRGFPVLGVRGVNSGKFFWKYRCKSVQFGAFWGHQVMESGTENTCFSAPFLKVGRNLLSLPYRFRGPWCKIAQNIVIMSIYFNISWVNISSHPLDYLDKHFPLFSFSHVDSLILCWQSLNQSKFDSIIRSSILLKIIWSRKFT